MYEALYYVLSYMTCALLGGSNWRTQAGFMDYLGRFLC